MQSQMEELRMLDKGALFDLEKLSLSRPSFGGLVSAWLAHTDDEVCKEFCLLTGGDGEEAERRRALAGSPPSW